MKPGHTTETFMCLHTAASLLSRRTSSVVDILSRNTDSNRSSAATSLLNPSLNWCSYCTFSKITVSVKGLFLEQGMPNGWKILFAPVRSRGTACVVTCPSKVLASAVVKVMQLRCVWLWLCFFCALPKDKMTNGNAGPEEKKQETEKALEDSSAGENHR